jgi:hypothetical protein
MNLYVDSILFACTLPLVIRSCCFVREKCLGVRYFRKHQIRCNLIFYVDGLEVTSLFVLFYKRSLMFVESVA